MSTIIHAQSGHTLCVTPIPRTQLPKGLEHSDDYLKFYKVQNWDKDGVVFMYVGKGCPDAPEQYVVWYRSGKFWTGFGRTLAAAIDCAQKDGWLYA